MKSKTGTKSGRTIGLPGGEQIPATFMTIRTPSEPRLRFDRSALGFLARLKTSLADSAPRGKTVLVTCTAPIWQDSKTSKALASEITQLIARRKTRFQASMFSNRVEVRIVKGGPGGLIGFIHNPVPGADVLFDLVRVILRTLDSSRIRRGAHALVIHNAKGRAPVRALATLCEALRVRAVFPKVFVTEGKDLHSLG